MYQSLLGALDYEIVTSLFEVSLENLRKSQSLEQNFKNWIWSSFGKIIPVIIVFLFLEYLIDISSIVFQESTFKNSK